MIQIYGYGPKPMYDNNTIGIEQRNSTSTACENLNRELIRIEIAPEYFVIV